MVNTLRNVIASPRYLMAAALSVLLFAGCKKNNDSEPESSVPVALKGAYRSYEVAEIRYKNDFDNTQPLAATVSGKDVNIAVIDDSTLGIVVMPDVFNEGSNALEFTDDNNPLSVTIVHQKGSAVTDPQQTFTEHKAEMQQQISFYEGLKAADTSGIFEEQDMKDVMDAAKASIAAMENAWATFNETEKVLLANIIAANAPERREIVNKLNEMATSIFDNRKDLQKSTQDEVCTAGMYPDKWDRYMCFGEHFAYESKRLLRNAVLSLGAVPLVFVGLVKPEYLKTVFGEFTTGAVNVYYISKELLTWRTKVIKTRVFNVVGAQKTTAKITLSKGQDNGMPVNITARRMQGTDASAGPGWISVVLSSVNSFNNFCDKYSIFLSKFRIQFADPSPAEMSIVNLSDISVSNISNSKVQFVSIGGTAESPTVKFTTQETSDQDFSFDVKYNDGVNLPITVKIDAKLTADDRMAIITTGTWRWVTVWETWMENGEPRSGEFLDECDFDDNFKFNLAGSGVRNHGAELCDSTAPAIQNFSWSFSNNQNDLNFLGASFNILSMSHTEFKVQRVYDDGGGMMVTQTATFVH